MPTAVPEGAAERLAVVDRILADPPVIHPMDATADPRMGVWSTEESCYRFLAERCPPGTRTLETGCGLSTVLFAALGAEHICCTAGREEADRVVAYCESHEIDASRVRFEVGSSHRSLPPLEAAGVERDIVLIDGSHAFPLPIVDWFYAGSLLRSGGVLVVDDLELPGVHVVADFLTQDPRWDRAAGTDKWTAWTRVRSGSLSEEWTAQRFYRPGRHPMLSFRRRLVGKIRHELTRRRS